jgi:hypothetical protein
MEGAAITDDAGQAAFYISYGEGRQAPSAYLTIGSRHKPSWFPQEKHD